jgi:hypothetical protein
MQTIEQQLAELGFTPGPDFARRDYRRDGTHIEIFDSLHIYMVSARHFNASVWCGAHFPLTVPIADALAVIAEHQQALHAAVVAVIAAAS